MKSHQNTLVDAVTGVRSLELVQRVGLARGVVVGDDNHVRGHLGDHEG